MRHGLQADFAMALACFEAEDSIGWLGVRTRGDTLEGLTRLLATHDVTLEEWFGVGVFSDHRSDLDARRVRLSPAGAGRARCSAD
jgi:hypothetical protein